MTLKKSRRRINEIIVHCTATPEGRDYTVADIRQMHKAQGWVDIGYHYLVYRDGSIHEGRNVDLVGAHCQGHNAQSIGVCYVGGVARDGKTPKDTRTAAQKDALVHLLMQLVCLYPGATIHGHRDFAAKACPSFDATREYKNL
jgi:N-acetylmuramoyl-L-alanine amidase